MVLVLIFGRLQKIAKTGEYIFIMICGIKYEICSLVIVNDEICSIKDELLLVATYLSRNIVVVKYVILDGRIPGLQPDEYTLVSLDE